jgi:hypothetical protein
VGSGALCGSVLGQYRVEWKQEVRENPRLRQLSLAEEWEPHCCESLRSNVELLVRHSPANMDVNTEAEEATALEAVTRQPMKTQKTEKSQCVLLFIC